MKSNYNYEDKNGIDGIMTLTNDSLVTHTVVGK